MKKKLKIWGIEISKKLSVTLAGIVATWGSTKLGLDEETLRTVVLGILAMVSSYVLGQSGVDMMKEKKTADIPKAIPVKEGE